MHKDIYNHAFISTNATIIYIPYTYGNFLYAFHLAKTLCQQGGFILDKYQWNVVQQHKPLTHHLHISSKLQIL